MNQKTDHKMDDDALVAKVMEIGAEAAKRGLVAIWTVYDRPTDHPEGHIARMHVAIAGGSTPTQAAFSGDLEEIRQVFADAGLTKLMRSDDDEPQIVECWL